MPYKGTSAGKSVGSSTKGPSGTAAGRAASSGKAVKASGKRTGGSTNSARQAKTPKQGS